MNQFFLFRVHHVKPLPPLLFFILPASFFVMMAQYEAPFSSGNYLLVLPSCFTPITLPLPQDSHPPDPFESFVGTFSPPLSPHFQVIPLFSVQHAPPNPSSPSLELVANFNFPREYSTMSWCLALIQTSTDVLLVSIPSEKNVTRSVVHFQLVSPFPFRFLPPTFLSADDQESLLEKRRFLFRRLMDSPFRITHWVNSITTHRLVPGRLFSSHLFPPVLPPSPLCRLGQWCLPLPESPSGTEIFFVRVFLEGNVRLVSHPFLWARHVTLPFP